MDTPTAYAKDVDSGAIPANALVKAECRTHLDNLDRAATDPSYYLTWDPSSYARICEYAVRHTNVADFVTQERIAFDPLPWQRFFLGMIFGWKINTAGCEKLPPGEGHPDDPLERLPGTRKIREAVLLTGRGSGKSPLGLLIAQFLMLTDPFFSGVCLAGTDEQAWRPFILMREMLNAGTDPDNFIDTVFHVIGASGSNNGQMSLRRDIAKTYPEFAKYKGKFVSTTELARAEKRVGGLPSYVAVEEFQGQGGTRTLNAYVSGFKAHTQPLLLFTMNACPDMVGPAWQMLEANRAAVRDGTLKDDKLHMEYAIEAGDLEIALQRDKKGKFIPEAKEIWRKANPSIGYTVRPDYYASELYELDSQSTQDRNDAIRQLFSVTPELPHDQEWFALERWNAALVSERPKWSSKRGVTA